MQPICLASRTSRVPARDRVEILVNNAESGQVASIVDDAPQASYSMMRLNVYGAFNRCHAVVPAILNRKDGRIINITSCFGKVGRLKSLAYCMSKVRLLAMTQSMPLELTSRGIRVNALCPA